MDNQPFSGWLSRLLPLAFMLRSKAGETLDGKHGSKSKGAGEFPIGGGNVLEKEPLSLAIDFVAIQIVLVRPVSVVRDYAQFSARHARSFRKWQRETEKKRLKASELSLGA